MSPRDIALAFAVTACWGAGLTFAKATMEQFPPVFLMAICLWVTALVMQVHERRTPQTSHLRGAAIALFAVSLQSALIFKGLSGLEASTGGLLSQVQVPMAIFAAWALRTEAVRLEKLIPIGIAFAGVAIIIGLPQVPPPAIPLVTMLLGTAAWGLGQAMIARYGEAEPTMLLKRTSLHGAVQLSVLTVLLEDGQWQALATADALDWLGLGYLAVIAFALAYIAWYGLLKRNPVSSVSPFIMVIPVVTLVTAVLLLGEPLTLPKLLGGALILLGVAMASGIIALPRLRRAD
jgi:O-acetylserine/cysteine efflux transporter